MENKKDFLQKTKYCDLDHSLILDIAIDVAKNHKTDKERAVALFYWVRDNVLYAVGSWSKKASEVLKQKRGMCTSKAVLLVTLLRSINIPAGFGILEVKGQEYMGPIAIPMFKKRIKKRSIHIYCYVFINDRWIKIDPSADKILSEKTSYFNPTTELVDWDGKNDAMENISPKTIIKDIGPIANIDDRLDKKPKTATGAILKVANIYLDFLRQNNQKINNVSELEPFFKKWLKKNHPIYHLLFLTSSKYRDIKNK